MTAVGKAASYAWVLGTHAEYDAACRSARTRAKKNNVVVYVDMCDKLPSAPWVVWYDDNAYVNREPLKVVCRIHRDDMNTQKETVFRLLSTSEVHTCKRMPYGHTQALVSSSSTQKNSGKLAYMSPAKERNTCTSLSRQIVPWRQR